MPSEQAKQRHPAAQARPAAAPRVAHTPSRASIKNTGLTMTGRSQQHGAPPLLFLATPLGACLRPDHSDWPESRVRRVSDRGMKKGLDSRAGRSATEGTFPAWVACMCRSGQSVEEGFGVEGLSLLPFAGEQVGKKEPTGPVSTGPVSSFRRAGAGRAWACCTAAWCGAGVWLAELRGQLQPPPFCGTRLVCNSAYRFFC